MPHENQLKQIHSMLADMHEMLVGKRGSSIIICRGCYVNHGNDTRVPFKDVGQHLMRHENARLAYVAGIESNGQ